MHALHWFDVSALALNPSTFSAPSNSSLHRYTSESGQTSCMECTGGTWATADNTGCTSDLTCPIGSGQVPEGGSCEVCSAGKHNGVEDDSACVPCAAGTYMYIGTTGSTSSDDCVDCEAGKYSGSVDGVSECTTCDAGKANANTASTEVTACQDCGIGKFSGIGYGQVRPPRARASEASAKKSWRRLLRKQPLLLREREIAQTTSFSCARFARTARSLRSHGALARHANNLFVLRFAPTPIPPPSSLLTHHAATAVLVL